MPIQCSAKALAACRRDLSVRHARQVDRLVEQPSPAGFDGLMPNTIATVDRLLHHAHIVMTAGDSIRLTQATAGKGVTPLTN